MTRVAFVKEEELSKEARQAYDNYVAQGKLSNMKQVLLKDYATYDAFMGWYTSWARLVEVVGKRAAMVYAHAISTTNGCLLCSLFFISDLKDLGDDPLALELDDKEQLLVDLGTQIVKDPNAVSDELFSRLRSHFNEVESVVIVGFAAQMKAHNDFNSVLRIDPDARLLPLKDDFKPITWRDDIR